MVGRATFADKTQVFEHIWLLDASQVTGSPWRAQMDWSLNRRLYQAWGHWGQPPPPPSPPHPSYLRYLWEAGLNYDGEVDILSNPFGNNILN